MYTTREGPAEMIGLGGVPINFFESLPGHQNMNIKYDTNVFILVCVDRVNNMRKKSKSNIFKRLFYITS